MLPRPPDAGYWGIYGGKSQKGPSDTGADLSDAVLMKLFTVSLAALGARIGQSWVLGTCRILARISEFAVTTVSF